MRLMEDLQYGGARNAAGYPLEEITVSDKWNGIRGVPVSLITLLCATMALGMLACTSEESPTEPSASAGPELAAVNTYTAVDLGTLGGTSSFARDINPAGHVVGGSQR